MRRLFPGMLALLVCAMPAGGTIVIPKSLAELAREAEAIIVAKVIANRCAWNNDHTVIWTTTELDVIETWKGESRARAQVMEPGGEVPPLGQVVASMARYSAGDRVLVFLKRDALGQWRTHGCNQGTFRILDSDELNRVEIRPWHRHVVKGALPLELAGSSHAPTVAEVKGRVDAILEAAREERR